MVVDSDGQDVAGLDTMVKGREAYKFVGEVGGAGEIP